MVQEEVVKLYNEVDSKVYVKDCSGLYWKANHKAAGWEDEFGYLHIRLGKKLYLAHRLIYLYYTGELPPLVDHIDRNPRNNHIDNLRGATKKLNAINSGIPINNTSKVKGVSWNKNSGKWTAQIKNDGVKIHLGSYSSLSDAVVARKIAEEELWSDVR